MYKSSEYSPKNELQTHYMFSVISPIKKTFFLEKQHFMTYISLVLLIKRQYNIVYASLKGSKEYFLTNPVSTG